jgi:hypothetical protein
MIEVTVVLKGNDEEPRSYRQKFLCYDPILIGEKMPLDQHLEDFIQAARKNFLGEPEEVQIKINMTV